MCDEPVSALDLSTQARVLDLFKEIQETTGVAYLFIHHDLTVVRHLSHRVAVMYRGEIVEDGDQVTSQPAHPYTQRLLLASPVPDPRPAGKTPQRTASAASRIRGTRRSGRLAAELTLDGPGHGTPLVDVELSAQFTGDNGPGISVGGFYDGDGIYQIWFQAPHAGMWTYVMTSTARSLDGLRGAFEVQPPSLGNHGQVAVADRFHFAYRDGTRFVPVGTTAYARTHQPEALQTRTLATLAAAPFRKLRMCVFPKSYVFNTNEPARYPFARDREGNWEFTRFDPQYFRQLEMRIAQLTGLGIETDLILFHAYDRWGFPEMPQAADDRYVQYLVRRVGAHRALWWSLANEHDLLSWKTGQDCERLAGVIRRNHHVGHLTSIHNCFGFYDHGRPWITHCSIQRANVYRTAENTGPWRDTYGKPVVIDECGYERDIDQGWGNLSCSELMRRFWEGAIRGGYFGPGETYLNEREELWWCYEVLIGASSADLRLSAFVEITDQGEAVP